MAIWDIKEIYNLQRSNQWAFKGDRCVFGGGYTSPADLNTIDFMSAAAGGTAADFGDLTAARGTMQDNYGTHTRGIFAGGKNLNTIDFVTIATTGDATDFGDLLQTRRYVAGGGNATRGIYGGGISPNPSNGHYDIIEYLTGASTGNTADFGDLTQTLERLCSLSSPTRQVWAAGAVPGDTVQNTIQFVSTATMGNAIDFGDLGTAKYGPMGVSDGIRGLVCGGNAGAPGHADFNHIESINFATAGNASDFGDLSGAYLASGSASAGTGATRGFVGHDGGATGVDMIQISTGGNGTDFGDISVARGGYAGVSNGHGGLGTDDIQRPSVTYMPGSGRALFNGGQLGNDALTSTVEMFHISTAGNAVDFGELNTVVSNGPGNGASNTRSVMYTGYSPASPYYDNTIQATTFSSFGNYFDFGDPTQQRYATSYGNIGSPTRAVFMGGYAPGSPYYVNIIDYITIATVGNGTDFGDLAAATNNMAGCGSSTRGIGMGGYTGSQDDTIQYVTIASTGNATDFGNLTAAKNQGAGVSSSTRGIMGGGKTPTALNVIEYITIASTGNGTDFGDLTQARNSIASASSSDRGVFMGGSTPSKVNTVDFITIASTGDAADFGDLTVATREAGGTSDSHGGLHG